MLPRCRLSIVLSLMLVTAFAACQPPPEPARRSVWGEIVALAQAEQSSAPALSVDSSRVVAGWIGADSAGVHQDIRQWIDGSLASATVLPLPPAHPYAQTLAAGQDGWLHLLWLDAAADGQTQLFSALITAQMTVERGPTPVSDELALRYAVTADSSERVWAAWSGRLLSEPVLSLRPIDPAGRPQPPQQVATNADYPALVRANDGMLLLFWLERGQLMRSAIHNGLIDTPVSLSSAVYLGAGDRLHSLSAGVDYAHAYVFWNVTRANGHPETWFAAGAIEAAAWAQPTQLQIEVLDGSTFETGFNTGSTAAAAPGETPLIWAAPLAGQYTVLPVAVQSPDGLGLVYLSSGSVVGYQTVVSDARLIAPPALAADRQRDLYLVWAQPSPHSAADLLLTTTHHAAME